MYAEVKVWGNSYGIRLGKKQLEKMGIQPGQKVKVLIEPAPGKIDVSWLPKGRAGSYEAAREEYYRTLRDQWE